MDEKRYLKAFIEKEDGVYRAIASTEVEDRHGEVVSMDGWDLKNFKKNPVLQVFHSSDELFVGRANKIKIDKTKAAKPQMIFEPEFHEKTPLSKALKEIVDMGWNIAFSVGFLPKEWDGNTYTKQELLEISVVNVPANPEALLMAKSLESKYSKDVIKQIIPDLPEDVEEDIEELKQKYEALEIEVKALKSNPQIPVPEQSVGRNIREEKKDVVLLKAIDKMTSSLATDPNPRIIKSLDKAVETLLIRQKERIKNG